MSNFYTNVDSFGGKLLDVVDREMALSKSVYIASGYTSYDILNRYKSRFLEIAENGGVSKLLLGMAFYEGLSANKLSLIKELTTQLRERNSDSGVYVSYSCRYHGKVYRFDRGETDSIYVGSSNFSRSGLSENIECTTGITGSQAMGDARHFLQFLFNTENAVSILDADITVPGTTRYLERLSLKTLDDLEKYNPESVNKSLYPNFDFSLAKAAESERSNLNVYFGKGRLTAATGKITPRPWYEVELIAPRAINSTEIYPKGDFFAYTDDGFIIPMKTSGDYFKNIRSRGNLEILGQWIKGKLQKKNALLPLTPVTRDTLDIYGKDTIRFYKMSEGKYFMEF